MKYEDTLMRPEVRALYYRRLREMSVEEKFGMISDLHDLARALIHAGVRAQHPSLSQEEVESEVGRRMRP